jgi:L-alanine-DL-glutamate epimerase-like enolase superfamily enzyme
MGSLRLWETPFSRGEQGIPINGLIWMGNFDQMYRQIETKLKDGFRCIKLKIGAIEFEEELTLIKRIRQRFSAEVVELRVDANGAFSSVSALEKLKRLSDFDIHSIEQPIAAGQWEAMHKLIEQTPFPIALDEDLIGINDLNEKQKLLDTIRPQYIILKPTLHGGLAGSEEWIELARSRGIGWWITSALESNVGLNAIAQWCSTLSNSLPQGLGTGSIYTNNIELPLLVEKDCLWLKMDKNTSIQGIER